MPHKIKNRKNSKHSKVVLLTATQIGKGELSDLGKRIAAHVEKVRDYEALAVEKAGVELKKADDHRTTIAQWLAEAKAKCNGGGFRAFQQKYCPQFGKSRIYELLQIGTGRKTVEEIRAEKRASVAKSRDKVSTTADVVDKSEVEPVGEVAAPVVEPEGQPPVSTAVSTLVFAPTLDSSGRLSAPDYIEPPKQIKQIPLGDGRVITSPTKPTRTVEASAEASAEQRKGLNADLELPAEQKAIKTSARYLAEFKASARLYLPKVTVEADRQAARLLVSELTATSPRLKTEAHRETQH